MHQLPLLVLAFLLPILLGISTALLTAHACTWFPAPLPTHCSVHELASHS